jgi:restriction endonuclease S subunit
VTSAPTAISRGFFNINYLKLTINSELDEMISRSHGGVGLRHIKKADFENMVLPLPPLREQVRIVNRVIQFQKIIDDLNKKLDDNEKIHFDMVKRLFSQSK